MINLVAPKGLGDAIYLRAVAEHLLSQGKQLKLWTRWRDIFSDLPVDIATDKEMADLENKKDKPEHHKLNAVTACLHCRVPYIMGLDKFTLACLQAGIEEPIELKINWHTADYNLISTIKEKANGKPIMVYQPLRKGRTPDDEVMRPKQEAFTAFINSKTDYFKIKLGHFDYLNDSRNLACDLNFIDKTTPAEALDIVSIADLVVGENCYLPIVAQAMDRKFVLMMARAAAQSERPKVHGVLPHRMVQKPHLGKVIWDE